MSLVFYRGSLCLVGPSVDQIARTAIANADPSYTPHLRLPSSTFHITVITKDELRDKSITDTAYDFKSADTRHVHAVGLGAHPKANTPSRNWNAFFVVIIWAAGQTLRKRFALAPKQFHITVSESDIHDVDKGIDSLLPGQYPEHPSIDLLDHIAFTFHLTGQYDRTRAYAVDLCKAAPTSERGFLRLGDAALKEGMHKLSMLAFACAWERCAEQKARDYCLKRIEECTALSEWGTVFGDAERTQVPDDLMQALLSPWSKRLREELSDRTLQYPPSLTILSREPAFLPLRVSKGTDGPWFRLPRFFRWLIPFHLAIMSTPRDASDIDALASPHLGIKHVLTLTEETPLDPKWFARKPIRNTFLPIPNYCPPSIEQMDVIMRLIDDDANLPLLVHCGGGKGRAGTVAACYLAAHGFAKPDPHRTQPAMSASEAITALRVLRPGSLETAQQEAFVAKYTSALWKRKAVLPPPVPEPPACALEIAGALPRDADLFVLVGLPGAGKSWFARALLARDPHGWTHICQDDAGGRAACERQIGAAPGGGKRVLLDRCNAARDDRAAWLALAHWARAPVCVWFAYDRALCTARAQARAGHPTLPPGGRVRSAVEQMERVFVEPARAEGFAAVVTVRSFAAAEELVARLSPPVGLFKFPRTAHLLDLGAVAADDLTGGAEAFARGGGSVVVTEKVDGANMGFSLAADRTTVVVQNRSHYVDAQSHAQFRKLGSWVAAHEAGLRRVLGRDLHFAQRYVLFGEWLVATHSIEYSRLPDWFLAFDLYDRSTGRWADRRTLEALLVDTGIGMVPVLHEGRMLSEKELRELVQGPSRFYDGRVEGVYVKVERDGEVVARGKVVRGDFISGNEHWSRGPLQLNAIAVERS